MHLTNHNHYPTHKTQIDLKITIERSNQSWLSFDNLSADRVSESFARF